MEFKAKVNVSERYSHQNMFEETITIPLTFNIEEDKKILLSELFMLAFDKIPEGNKYYYLHLYVMYKERTNQTDPYTYDIWFLYNPSRMPSSMKNWKAEVYGKRYNGLIWAAAKSEQAINTTLVDYADSMKKIKEVYRY